MSMATDSPALWAFLGGVNEREFNLSHERASTLGMYAAQLTNCQETRVTRADKAFVILGKIFLAIVVVAAVELLSTVASLKLNQAYVDQLGLGTGPSTSLKFLAQLATFAERFSFVLYVPAILLAIALGVRRIRAASTRDA